MLIHRTLRACVATANDGTRYDVAEGTYDGRTHLIVPVIALIGDTAIWASNATSPELVPRLVIEDSVLDWNGRPLVSDHPTISANDIAADGLVFGRVANPRVDSEGRLALDAWVCVDKAEKLGGSPAALLERLRSAEEIEVSVGVRIAFDPDMAGVDKLGTEYTGVWLRIAPDHLAMLPAGTPGACGNKMGCGVREGKHTGERLVRDSVKGGTMPKRFFVHRLLAKLGGLFQPSREAASANETADALRKALAELEPDADYLYVEDVWMDESPAYFIYGIYDDSATHYYRREFSVGADGVLSISGERTEMQRAVAWTVAPPRAVVVTLPGETSDSSGSGSESDSTTTTATANAANRNSTTACACTERNSMEKGNPASTSSPATALPADSVVTMSADEAKALRALAAAETQRQAREREELITEVARVCGVEANTLTELPSSALQTMRDAVASATGRREARQPDFSLRSAGTGARTEAPTVGTVVDMLRAAKQQAAQA